MLDKFVSATLTNAPDVGCVTKEMRPELFDKRPNVVPTVLPFIIETWAICSFATANGRPDIFTDPVNAPLLVNTILPVQKTLVQETSRLLDSHLMCKDRLLGNCLLGTEFFLAKCQYLK